MARSVSTTTALGAALCWACLLASPVSADSNSHLIPRASDGSKDLRIMPLGASITFGWDSSTGNGYRAFLQTILQSKNYKVTFVGTQHSGDMPDNAVEAYPGDTISEINDKAQSSGAYNAKPNVVLLNAGTNDCSQQKYDPKDAPHDYADLLDTVSQSCPGALIIASSLIPNLDDDENACIRDLNPHLYGVAKRAKEKGQNVEWVNMYDGVPKSLINTTDGTHPNDPGYQKMAGVWADGIMKAAGEIQNPGASDPYECGFEHSLSDLFSHSSGLVHIILDISFEHRSGFFLGSIQELGGGPESADPISFRRGFTNCTVGWVGIEVCLA